jgi:hypothetical protein
MSYLEQANPQRQKIEVARDQEEGEVWFYRLMVTELLLGVVKKFWKCIDPCKILQM